MTTTLQIRVDEKLKRDARKTLEDMGLDLSSGLNLFLRQVVNTQSIPWPVASYNNLTSKQKQILVAEAEEAFRTSKRYKNIEDLHRDILK